MVWRSAGARMSRLPIARSGAASAASRRRTRRPAIRVAPGADIAPAGRQIRRAASTAGQSALHTLAQLGYARTSLREIAQNSEFSHGVLHYYFSDKVDLLTESVRHYEAECVTRYDDIVAAAKSAGDSGRASLRR